MVLNTSFVSVLTDPHTGKNTTQTRDYLYRLMVSQLFYDGFHQMASGLVNVIQV